MHGISEQTIINYQSGYNSGISYADSRVNESSINYTTGYNSGYNEGSSKVTIDGKSVKDKMELVSATDSNVILMAAPNDIVISTELDGAIYVFSSHKFYKCVAGSLWEEVGSLPIVPQAAVTLGSEMHILCSDYYGDNSGSHYKWDGVSWAKVSTLSFSFLSNSVVVLNNEIHVLGCNPEHYSSSNPPYEYNRHFKWDGSTWVYVGTVSGCFYKIPGNSWGLDYAYSSAVVLNNEIHILGGVSVTHYSYGDTSGTHDAYSVSSKQRHYKINGSALEELGRLPDSFVCGSVVVLNDEIHILGGWRERRSGDSYQSIQTGQTIHYKWDGASWSNVGILPYEFTFGSAVVAKGKIHIFGGRNTKYGMYTENNARKHSVISAHAYI